VNPHHAVDDDEDDRDEDDDSASEEVMSGRGGRIGQLRPLRRIDRDAAGNPFDWHYDCQP